MSSSWNLHILVVLAACALRAPSLQTSPQSAAAAPPPPASTAPGGAVLAQEALAQQAGAREEELSQALDKLVQVVHTMGTSVQAATQSAAYEQQLRKELEAVEASHVQAEAAAGREARREAELGHGSIAAELQDEAERMRQSHRRQERHLEAESQALHEAVDALSRRALQASQAWPASSGYPMPWPQDLLAGQNAQGWESQSLDLQPMEGSAGEGGNFPVGSEQGPLALPPSPPSAIDEFSGPPEARVKQDYFRSRPEQDTVTNPGAAIDTLPDASREPVQGEQGQEVFTRHTFDDFLAAGAAGAGAPPPPRGGSPAAPPPPAAAGGGLPQARDARGYSKSPTEDDLDVVGNTNPVVSNIFDGGPLGRDAESAPGMTIDPASARREADPGSTGQEFGNLEEAVKGAGDAQARVARGYSKSPTEDDLDVVGNTNPVVSNTFDGSPLGSGAEAAPGMTIDPASARREAYPGATGQELGNLEEAVKSAGDAQARVARGYSKSPTEDDLDVVGNTNPVVSNIFDGSPLGSGAEAAPGMTIDPASARREAYPGATGQELGNSEEASQSAPPASIVPADGVRQAAESAAGIAAAEGEPLPGASAHDSATLQEAQQSAAAEAGGPAAAERRALGDEEEPGRPLPSMEAGLPLAASGEAPPAAGAEQLESPEAAAIASRMLPDASSQRLAAPTNVFTGEAEHSVATEASSPDERLKNRKPRFTFEDFDDSSLGAPAAQQDASASTPGDGPVGAPMDRFRRTADAGNSFEDAAMQPQSPRPTQSLDDYLAGMGEPSTSNDPHMRMPEEEAATSGPAASSSTATTSMAPAAGAGLATPAPGADREEGPAAGGEGGHAEPEQPAAPTLGQEGEPALPAPPPSAPPQAGSADPFDSASGNGTTAAEGRAQFGPAQVEAVKWAKQQVDQLLRERLEGVHAEAQAWAKSEVDRLEKELAARWAKEEAGAWRAAQRAARGAVVGVAERWASEAAATASSAKAPADPSPEQHTAAPSAVEEDSKQLQQHEEEATKAEQEVMNRTAEGEQKVDGSESIRGLEEVINDGSQASKGMEEVSRNISEAIKSMGKDVNEALKGMDGLTERQLQAAEEAAAAAAAAASGGALAKQQAAANCAAWPTEAAYGCGGKQRNWFKLSNYTNDEECRSLCGEKANEMGRLCCYVGQSFGCWLKPNSEAIRFGSGPGKGVTCAARPTMPGAAPGAGSPAAAAEAPALPAAPASSQAAAPARRLPARRPRPPAP